MDAGRGSRPAGGAGDAQTPTGGVVVVADTTPVSAPPPPSRTTPGRRPHPPRAESHTLTVASRCGTERAASEDRWVALTGDGTVLLAVADGMGGTLGGGEAATAALATLVDHLTTLPPGTDALAAATRAAHERVRSLAGDTLPTAFRPGTTLTAALVTGGRLHLVHAGDSSAWLLRRGRLRRLTEVHSQGAALVAAGAVAAGSPAERRLDGLLTRYLGMPGTVHPQQTAVRLRAGDRLLVASDGVTRALAVPRLATLLARPHVGAPELVDAAVEAGGRDDATALLAGVDTRPVDLNTRYTVHHGETREVPAR